MIYWFGAIQLLTLAGSGYLIYCSQKEVTVWFTKFAVIQSKYHELLIRMDMKPDATGPQPVESNEDS